jgi:hypothetical protein
MGSFTDMAPTPKLRFVVRPVGPTMQSVLQQWWAHDVPEYMREPNKGEWRDVETFEESP